MQTASFSDLMQMEHDLYLFGQVWHKGDTGGWGWGWGAGERGRIMGDAGRGHLLSGQLEKGGRGNV